MASYIYSLYYTWIGCPKDEEKKQHSGKKKKIIRLYIYLYMWIFSHRAVVYSAHITIRRYIRLSTSVLSKCTELMDFFLCVCVFTYKECLSCNWITCCFWNLPLPLLEFYSPKCMSSYIQSHQKLASHDNKSLLLASTSRISSKVETDRRTNEESIWQLTLAHLNSFDNCALCKIIQILLFIHLELYVRELIQYPF